MGIKLQDWTVEYVRIEVDSSPKSERVLAGEPTYRRIVVSGAIVGCTPDFHQRWFPLSALPEFSR